MRRTLAVVGLVFSSCIAIPAYAAPSAEAETSFDRRDGDYTRAARHYQQIYGAHRLYEGTATGGVPGSPGQS